MASRASTPRSRSRSSVGSSSSSDTAMIDAPLHSPRRPVRVRALSTSNPSKTAASTASDPAFSLLLSLPRELREHIYAFTLISPYPFWWPNQATIKYDHNIGVNLLRASRQVYNEAVPILYSGNKFLFTHPSDCNIFRVVASPFSSNIQSVYFRIREKDLRLWTAYLGSKSTDRSLRADLPKLKNLWIFLRCGSMGTPAMLGQLNATHAVQAGHGLGGLPPGIQMQVQAVHNALGQQVQALQQQLQNWNQILAQQGGAALPQNIQPVGDNAGNHPQPLPPPPPPPPHPMPFLQFAQGGQGLAGHGQGLHHHHHHHPHPPPPPPHHHGPQNQPPNPSLLVMTHAQHNPVPQPHHHAHGQFAHGQPLPGQHVPPNQGAGMPQHHPHAHHARTLYTTFLRFEREIGLESLCLSLQETLRERSADPNFSPSSDYSSPSTLSGHSSSTTSTPPEIKIVCIMRIPDREVERLVRLYPNELVVDRNGDARTKFRKLHGVEVSLEVSGYPIHSTGDGTFVQG